MAVTTKITTGKGLRARKPTHLKSPDSAMSPEGRALRVVAALTERRLSTDDPATATDIAVVTGLTRAAVAGVLRSLTDDKIVTKFISYRANHPTLYRIRLPREAHLRDQKGLRI